MEPSHAIFQRLQLSEDGTSWWTRFSFEGHGEVELEILNMDGRPCPERLVHATRCLEDLDPLTAKMACALTSAPDHPLFPPREERRWLLQSLVFADANPKRGAGAFSLDESGYRYIYVQYFADLEDGRVIGVRADTY